MIYKYLKSIFLLILVLSFITVTLGLASQWEFTTIFLSIIKFAIFIVLLFIPCLVLIVNTYKQESNLRRNFFLFLPSLVLIYLLTRSIVILNSDRLLSTVYYGGDNGFLKPIYLQFIQTALVVITCFLNYKYIFKNEGRMAERQDRSE